MSDRPTPETDEASFSTVYQGELVKASFARRLERERDELLKALEELLAASLRFPSYHVISNQQQRRLDIACRSAEVAFLAAVKGDHDE